MRSPSRPRATGYRAAISCCGPSAPQRSTAWPRWISRCSTVSSDNVPTILSTLQQSAQALPSQAGCVRQDNPKGTPVSNPWPVVVITNACAIASPLEGVEPDAHAILILDQAGWHGAKQLKIPANISFLPLPPRAPELNSQENIWQFMRQNWLSNRIFKSFDDIVDHCCVATVRGWARRH